jgi:uncharacterized protein YbgA (DUF1722 family)
MIRALGFDFTHLIMTIAGYLPSHLGGDLRHQLLPQLEAVRSGRQRLEFALTRMAGAVADACP